jgi:putative transposase
VAAKRRRYTASERRRVLADVKKLGVAGAARRHGVPESCVSRWKQKALGRSGRAPKGKSGTGNEELTGIKVARSGARQRAQRSRGTNADTDSAEAEPGAMVAAKEERPNGSGNSRVARVYTPSQRAEALELAAEVGVVKAAEQLGMSRFSVWDGKRKVKKASVGQGDSPTAGASSSEIEAQRDQEILAEWHRQPGLGPSQIRNQLRRKGVKVAVHTVRRVMEEDGYRPPKVQRTAHDQRYESVRPNHRWHLDFVQRHINRTNTFTLILIDDYSRFVVGHGVDETERADMVLATFERAVEQHGRPERVMHDKGSAFWSWRGISRFTALLTELDIDQEVAEHKEWNGKVEVFNANLHKEFFDVQRFYDVSEMKRRLAAHMHWYNHARTHHALGGLLVPADRYYGRVEEVLARIEAGAGRDVGDLLDLRERCLELFKVVSHGGVPEVWLLGQKLLELSSPSGGRTGA